MIKYFCNEVSIMDDKIILSTTPNLEGYKILEYVDLIYDEICFSPKAITQLKNWINDIISYASTIFVDEELNGTSSAINQAKTFLLERLKKVAMEKGANAVVGIDFETSFGTAKTFIRCSVNGTAVKVKELVELEKEENDRLLAVQEKERAQKEKEEKINNLRNSQTPKKSFIYEDHENQIKDLKNLDELLEYLEILQIEDPFFKDEVIPEIKKLKEAQRLYGSMFNSAIVKLKEMTTLNK